MHNCMHHNTLLVHEPLSFHDYTYYHSCMHAGADVNARDHRMQTPLHVAAMEGEQRVMKFLLDKKADAMAKDLDGNTPVDLAMIKDEDIVLNHSEHADIENNNSVIRTLEDAITSGSNISDDEVREKIWELSRLRYTARLILCIALLSPDPHTCNCLQCSQSVQA